jgi:hypothetical protein
MAKAILEYDLTDPDDKMEFERATKSLDMALALWEFGYNTKKSFQQELEANDKTKDEEYELLDKVYARFLGILNGHNINIDNLIS